MALRSRCAAVLAESLRFNSIILLCSHRRRTIKLLYASIHRSRGRAANTVLIRILDTLYCCSLYVENIARKRTRSEIRPLSPQNCKNYTICIMYIMHQLLISLSARTFLPQAHSSNSDIDIRHACAFCFLQKKCSIKLQRLIGGNRRRVVRHDGHVFPTLTCSVYYALCTHIKRVISV